MKYLSDYTDEATTAALDKAGAFFAFGNSRFEELKKPGTVYVSMGAGLLCPKENADQLARDITAAGNEGRKADMAENGIDAIIQRELANHEAQITGDLYDTIVALEGYDITLDQVKAGYKIFFDRCVEEDLF